MHRCDQEAWLQTGACTLVSLVRHRTSPWNPGTAPQRNPGPGMLAPLFTACGLFGHSLGKAQEC